MVMIVVLMPKGVSQAGIPSTKAPAKAARSTSSLQGFRSRPSVRARHDTCTHHKEGPWLPALIIDFIAQET